MFITLLTFETAFQTWKETRRTINILGRRKCSCYKPSIPLVGGIYQMKITTSTIGERWVNAIHHKVVTRPVSYRCLGIYSAILKFVILKVLILNIYYKLRKFIERGIVTVHNAIVKPGIVQGSYLQVVLNVEVIIVQEERRGLTGSVAPVVSVGAIFELVPSTKGISSTRLATIREQVIRS